MRWLTHGNEWVFKRIGRESMLVKSTVYALDTTLRASVMRPGCQTPVWYCACWLSEYSVSTERGAWKKPAACQRYVGCCHALRWRHRNEAVEMSNCHWRNWAVLESNDNYKLKETAAYYAEGKWLQFNWMAFTVFIRGHRVYLGDVLVAHRCRQHDCIRILFSS